MQENMNRWLQPHTLCPVEQLFLVQPSKVVWRTTTREAIQSIINQLPYLEIEVAISQNENRRSFPL